MPSRVCAHQAERSFWGSWVVCWAVCLAVPSSGNLVSCCTSRLPSVDYLFDHHMVQRGCAVHTVLVSSM